MRPGLQIQVLWQPIVELTTQRVVGYEALGRIESIPDLATALSQGPAASLADWLLRVAALRTTAQLPPDTRLFINLAPPTVEAVVASGQPLGVRAGGRVVWELPEAGGWQIESADQARTLFGEFALDDVGIGYADLDRIQRLRPPWLKIARPLVQDCHQDKGKQDVIRALCWLADRYGGRVVAEGVENENEALCIASLGVRYAQGFLFGRPEPPNAWLPPRTSAP